MNHMSPDREARKKICPTNLQLLILTQHMRVCDDPFQSKHVPLGVTTRPRCFEGSHAVRSSNVTFQLKSRGPIHNPVYQTQVTIVPQTQAHVT